MDTDPLRRSALRESLLPEGLSLSDGEWDEHCRGLATSHATERLVEARGDAVDQTAVELIALRANRLFADRVAGGLPLLPGAVALVDSLGGRARLGIVTGAPRQTVDFVLSLAGLEHAFQCIVAAEDVRISAPSAAPHDLAVARLHRRTPFDRSAAIALEGSNTGIRSALAAGLRCVAVGTLPVWQRMGADAWFPSLEGVTLRDLTILAAPSGTPR